MPNKNKDNGSVVKIDSSLLKKIDDFINREENKYQFVNKKQFIDIAVFEFLKKYEKGAKKNENER